MKVLKDVDEGLGFVEGGRASINVLKERFAESGKGRGRSVVFGDHVLLDYGTEYFW